MERNGNFLVALGTLVTAAFTAILGGATVALWRPTRDLVAGTERSLAPAQRPWIRVEAAIAGPLHVNGVEPSVTLKLTVPAGSFTVLPIERVPLTEQGKPDRVAVLQLGRDAKCRELADTG